MFPSLCSSVGKVMVFGAGVQSFKPSFSRLFLIFKENSFKGGNKPKGEQQEQELENNNSIIPWALARNNLENG